MINLQLLTGIRPGEVCLMRGADLDASNEVWIYTRLRHKKEHLDRERVINLRPKAKAIITLFLRSDENACGSFFSADSRAAPGDPDAQQVELRPAIHLPHQLQAVHMSFRSPVAPRVFDRRTDPAPLRLRLSAKPFISLVQGGLMMADLLQKRLQVAHELFIFEATPRLGAKRQTLHFGSAKVAYEAGAAEFYDHSEVGPDPLRELADTRAKDREVCFCQHAVVRPATPVSKRFVG